MMVSATRGRLPLLLAALLVCSATPLFAAADLVATLYYGQDTAAGSEVTFIGSVRNLGPDTAHDAIVSIEFSPLTSFGDLIFCAGDQPCTGTGGLYNLALGDLVAGQYTSFYVSVYTSASAGGGTLTCLAAVAAQAADGSPIDDPDPSNDIASQTISVLAPAADLFVIMTPSTGLVGAGSDVTLELEVGNAGPNQAGQVSVVVYLPPGLAASSCTAPGGVCEIDPGGLLRVRYDSIDVGALLGHDESGQPVYAPARSIALGVTADRDAPPGSEVSPTAQILSAANSDPNGVNDYARSVLLLEAPPSTFTSVSTSLLHLPPAVIHYVSTASVTLTNTSSASITVATPFLIGDFRPYTDTCFPGGLSYPIDDRIAVVDPGQSCTTTVEFDPKSLGPSAGQLVLRQVAPVGQQVVALDGVSYGLDVQATLTEFSLLPVGASANGFVGLSNLGPRPVRLISIVAAGSDFSQTNPCPDVLQPGESCTSTVTFSPTVAGLRTGTLTITDDDTYTPRVIALTGHATGLALVGPGSFPGQMFFGNRPLAVPVTEVITLKNVGRARTQLNRIVLEGDGDFVQKNNCSSVLKPGDGCQIRVLFTPQVLGARQATITIEDRGSGVPQTFGLFGTGIGIGAQKHVRLHYDYMVLPDQGTPCTPDFVDPYALPGSADCDEGQHCIDHVCRGHSHKPPDEAIRKVVDAFAERGVRLEIDPISIPVPESRYLFITSPPTPCPGVRPDLRNAAYFYDLKAAYYKPGSEAQHEHYTIFGHYGYEAIACLFNGGETNSIPGYDFMVTQGGIYEQTELAVPPDERAEGLAGTMMHELGHNLGLHHPDPNYAPNVLSVMNYRYQFGIPRADDVGSDAPDPARTLIDYSDRVLPARGNTPGRLDPTDLNEPDGLGSGDEKVFSFESPDGVHLAACEGPVDFDGDGVADNAHAQDPFLNFLDCPGCPVPSSRGRDDWSYLFTGDDHLGTPEESAASAGVPSRRVLEPELTVEEAKKHHVLLLPRAVRLVIPAGPGCGSPPGTLTLGVLGGPDLEIDEVEPSSLKLHGAEPLSQRIADLNGDGVSDLLLTFDTARVKLGPHPARARLSGWLKSSRLFAGEVDAAALQAAACP